MQAVPKPMALSPVKVLVLLITTLASARTPKVPAVTKVVFIEALVIVLGNLT